MPLKTKADWVFAGNCLPRVNNQEAGFPSHPAISPLKFRPASFGRPAANPWLIFIALVSNQLVTIQ
jgi:hypothetical protein